MALPAPLALFRLEGSPWPDAKGVGAIVIDAGSAVATGGKFGNAMTVPGDSGLAATATAVAPAAFTKLSVSAWLNVLADTSANAAISVATENSDVCGFSSQGGGFSGYLASFLDDSLGGVASQSIAAGWHHFAVSAEVGQPLKSWLDGSPVTNTSIGSLGASAETVVLYISGAAPAFGDVAAIDDVAILPGHIFTNADVAYLWNGGTGTLYPAAGASTGGSVASIVSVRSPFKNCLPPQPSPLPYARRLN